MPCWLATTRLNGRSKKKVRMNDSVYEVSCTDLVDGEVVVTSPTKCKTSYKGVCICEDMDSDETFVEETYPYKDIFDEEKDGGMENDKECTTVKVTKEEKKRLCNRWKNALIIKLVEHSVGYNFWCVSFAPVAYQIISGSY